MRGDARISVISPALNEEAAIGRVIAAIPGWVDEVLISAGTQVETGDLLVVIK